MLVRFLLFLMRRICLFFSFLPNHQQIFHLCLSAAAAAAAAAAAHMQVAHYWLSICGYVSLITNSNHGEDIPSLSAPQVSPNIQLCPLQGTFSKPWWTHLKGNTALFVNFLSVSLLK